MRKTNGGIIMDDKINNYYKLATMIKMDAESIPEDMIKNMFGEHYCIYEKAKEKNEDLSKFLVGMFFVFGGIKESVATSLITMAYLGLEEVKSDD